MSAPVVRERPDYPRWPILLLAAVQFTNILDFMIMMPLGPQLMRTLDIGPAEVGQLVSSYTWTAALFGVVASFYIDRVARKRALLVAYTGFFFGTVLCAVATSFLTLLAARALAGAFGGLLGSVVLAFAADLSPPRWRASAMGTVMASFSVASVAGVPAGLWLATHASWQSPFWMVSGLSVVLGVLVAIFLPAPAVVRHTGVRTSPFTLLRQPNAVRALVLMMALVVSHFIVVPFISPYLVGNVGLTEAQLPLIYLVGGAVTLFTTPLVGRMADRVGRLPVLSVMAAGAITAMLLLTNLPPWPLPAVLAVTGLFFIFGSGRFVPVQAITSSAITPRERGAFMSLNSAMRDLAAGLVALLGGHVVTKADDGSIHGYAVLGWIAVGATLLSLWLARRVKSVELASAE